jgi:hypothetical protein
LANRRSVNLRSANLPGTSNTLLGMPVAFFTPLRRKAVECGDDFLQRDGLKTICRHEKAHSKRILGCLMVYLNTKNPK